MRARSATSLLLDSYQSGREIGASLRSLEPELVVVFASIHYDFAEQREGIIDALGRDDVMIFGGTGDGFFETSSSSDIGVSALGIAGDGALRLHAHIEPGLGADSRAAARRCAEAVKVAAGGAPIKLALVLFDALSCTDNRVIEGINEVLDCPVFGGITSDDRKLQRSYVILDGQRHADAVGILALSGEFEFSIAVENGACPVGDVGVVEAAQGNTLLRIDGVSAIEFVAARLGKSPKAFTHQDVGVINFQCSNKPDMSDAQYRSVSQWQADNGALETFGPVEVGQYVRVVIVTSDELLAGVDAVLNRLDSIGERFEPAAAIGISCAGRKWFLGPRFSEEIEAVRRRRAGLPLIGFPSLGEVAPRRRADGSYSPNLFHNVSFVLALLGPATQVKEMR